MKLIGKALKIILITVIVVAQYSTVTAGTTVNTTEVYSVTKVRDFIKNNWKNTIRTHKEDSLSFIGLPYPYTVPSMRGMFQEMYYWDTYFSNAGLIADGDIQQAKYNCMNIAYLVEKFGFMPNGNRTWFLERSQPPFFSMMVRDVYQASKDKEWLKRMLPAIEKEYWFWMKNRISNIGLNYYSNSATDTTKLKYYQGISKRLSIDIQSQTVVSEAEKIKIGSHYIAECESGWDFTPRFEGRCEDFCPVDLNSYLYMYEINFDYFNQQLDKKDSGLWLAAAQKRKALMNKYMYNAKNQLFYDYDYVNRRLSPVYSAAVFTLLWAKLATPTQAQAIVKNMSKLEYKAGIATCAPVKREILYQWDYPNGWPCVQFMAVKGLDNYKYRKIAQRIAQKYVRIAADNYHHTNALWEKYNITDGSIKVQNEYEMPQMMGWTAGTFVSLSDYLKKNK